MQKGHQSDSIWVTDGEDQVLLPPWATFLIDIGAAAISAQNPQARLTLALALPARAYAATFVAVGVVLARAENGHETEEGGGHFERLCQMPLGTAVRFFDESSGRLKRAILNGVCTADGKRRLRVQVTRSARDTERRGGSQAHLVGEDGAHKITVAEGERWRLPATQSGRRVSGSSAILGALLGHSQASRFLTASAFDCAILGEASILRKEILETGVCVLDGEDREVKGSLQDILRVRRFCSPGQPYRTRVVPVATWKRRPSVQDIVPRVVVLDGAAAFLKWRAYWCRSNWVVVLDRSERLFQSAASTLNESYAASRIGDANLDGIGDVPPGTELLAYEEALG